MNYILSTFHEHPITCTIAAGWLTLFAIGLLIVHMNIENYKRTAERVKAFRQAVWEIDPMLTCLLPHDEELIDRTRNGVPLVFEVYLPAEVVGLREEIKVLG